MPRVLQALFGIALAAGCARAPRPEPAVAHHWERWGRTRVLIAGGDVKGRGEGPVVVYLHGFASSPLNELPLAAQPGFPEGTRFVFPEGPIAIDGGPRRAFWMLDYALRDRLRSERNGMRELEAHRPRGVWRARSIVTSVMESVPEHLGVPPERTVLAGFSQGAMLACDTALRTRVRMAGLGSLSGTLTMAQDWIPRMPARRGLPAFVSHGRDDVRLPFALSERLAAELTEAGLRVRWHPHDGGHRMRPSVARAFARFVTDVTR